jgi:phosphoserine phosphatase RsbU/P
MDQMTDINRKQLALNSLIEFSQLINTKLDLEFIFGNMLLSIMGKMLIMKGAILLKSGSSERKTIFSVKAVKGIGHEFINKEIALELPTDPIFNATDIKNPDFFINNKLNSFFKIYFVDKLIGLFCLGNKFNGEELSKSEILFLETLLNLSSPTIENSIKFEEIKKLNSSLNSQLQHLRSLFELSKELNSNFQNRENVIKLLKYSLLGNFGIKDYLIFSKDKKDGFYLKEASRQIAITSDLLDLLNGIKEPEVLTPSQASSKYNTLLDLGFKLILPISRQNDIEAIVCLGNKLSKQEFTINDIQFLESLTNLTVISLDNISLFNEFLNKQKIESELKIAREIQLALLPDKTPEIKGYSLSGYNIPAQQIGGDYYDIIKLTETKFAFVIADVSGKGTPASLLMASIQSAVHSFLKFYNEEFSIEDVTLKLNQLIYSNTNSEKFITFFWGILDTEKSTFRYVNAGHNPPFLVNDTKNVLLDKGGLILGILETGLTYESDEIILEKGDFLLMYTDGVSEAKNDRNEEFSDARILKLLKNNISASAESLKDILTIEVKQFSEGCTQFDDITIIALKKL